MKPSRAVEVLYVREKDECTCREGEGKGTCGRGLLAQQVVEYTNSYIPGPS